jgi:outer membrane protein assembly factor BamE (lipoprotein component of BamABCDE complex)
MFFLKWGRRVSLRGAIVRIPQVTAIALAWILASCASAVPENIPRYSDQSIARLMAVNDALVVPGERIGPVFVGMTETQLYQKLGEPSASVRGNNGIWVQYFYTRLGLGVQVNPKTHKVNVVDSNGVPPESQAIERFPYETKEGISLNTSELRLATMPWKLVWKRHDFAACWTFQYDGIRINTCDGIVTAVTVHAL